MSKDKKRTPHKKNERSSGEFLMGRNSLKEILSFAAERIVRVWYTEGDRTIQQLISELPRSIEIHKKSAHELTQICRSESHQGVVAELAPRTEVTLSELLESLCSPESPSARLVLLDGVEDPHNFGAILRACECFGIDGVIFSKHRAAPVTAVVRKVSQGASELVVCVEVVNLHDAILKLKERGVWIIGAELSERSKSVVDFEPPDRWALVLGSEGDGIRPVIQKEVDFPLSIPMQGRLDSLNVSQAAAVFCYQLTKGSSK